MIEPERLAYPLTRDSLCWDIGSYRGEWAAAIKTAHPACHVEAFECLSLYVPALQERLAGMAVVHPFGLAERDYEQEIPLAGDRTSAYQEANNDPLFHAGPMMPARFRDVIGFMDEHDIREVALAKINIEGGEYALLRRLIDAGRIWRFEHLQVQFHTFIPQFGELYKALEKDLKRTHVLSWRHPWRWESWHQNS